MPRHSTPDAPVMPPVAHPYARISDPEQRKGGGLIRQTSDETAARIREFCKLHDFAPAKRIRVDDGISAWKGLNASPDHELGQFIADARRGTVRPGDCLLIENWDRLSRQNIWAAVALVNDLRELGIHVGRLDRMKLLRCDSTDPGDFFEAAIELMRGNSESEAKSMRNRAKWHKRRKDAREGKTVLTRRLPAWLRLVDGKPVEIPERGAVVRRIFALSAAGHGLFVIKRTLEGENVPAFGPSGRWSIAYLDLILKDRRALGELQPRLTGGEPDGPPIANYFPALVDEELWGKVRLGARLRHRKGGRQLAEVNVFQGLLKDARSEAATYTVAAETSKGTPHRILKSLAPRNGSGPANSFPLVSFEDAVLSALAEIDAHEILNGDHPDESKALAAEAAAVEGEIAKIEADLDRNGHSDALSRALRRWENRLRELMPRLAEAQQKAANPLSATWGEAQTLIGAVAAAPDRKEARLRLRSALRRIVDRIWLLVVPRGRDRLAAVQIWFAGGKRHRDYLILHRPPLANRHTRRDGMWDRIDLADLTDCTDLDLRRRDDAAALAALLERVDPKGIGKTGK